MGKNMARLDENNVVINIEWCDINTPESNILINIYDYPVSPGDTYKDGYFYSNGERLLTEIEFAYNKIEVLETKQEELITSYQEGINSI